MGLWCSKPQNKFKPDYFHYHLASPLSELQDSYDVIVVGSGYGGSIAASRCARAGQRVCLLERGKEWRPGDFPETEFGSMQEVQLTVHGEDMILGDPTDLYDVTISPDILVLKGCGLGGTSLINANVALDSDPRIFEDKIWPKELIDDMDNLNGRYRQRVYDMLKPAEYPYHYPIVPKQKAFQTAATALADIENLPLNKVLKTTPIYVNFKDQLKNHVGVPQPACNNCGNCCSGCNTGAKNTLNMNYLPDAKAHGAHIFTKVDVKIVTRDEDAGLWRVNYVPLGKNEVSDTERVVTAPVVIVGGGTLGSTNILLNSKRRGALEPSSRLGHGFSTNGDTVGFAYNTDKPLEPVGIRTREAWKDINHGPGPGITKVIDLRDRIGKGVEEGYVLQDGTAPSSVELPYKFVLKCLEAAHSGVDTTPGEDDWKELVRHVTGRAFSNSAMMLAMSNDTSEGTLKLDHTNGRVWVDYPDVGEERNFKIVSEGMKRATEALRGTYIPNPYWAGIFAKLKHTKGVTTVHPLGGCGMGDTGKEGVVNHGGQVFKGDTSELYPGLYVMDGAVIPRSLGVNPTLTISMVAERCMELLAKDRGWKIDYGSTKQFDFPE